jgi:hypothetical protein
MFFVTNRTLLTGFLCLLLLMTNSYSSILRAEPPITIGWQDLQPSRPPPTDPLSELDPVVAYELELVASSRILQKNGEIGPGNPLYEEAIEYERGLLSRGVDVNGFISRYRQFHADLKQLGNELNISLNRTNIRIAGYLLPLEFADLGVTEFLLVPYVGACIHVPPPPPNQLVQVSLSEPMISTELYFPVWVSGILHAQHDQTLLALVDGEAQVPTGYKIPNATVVPYE